MPASRRGTGFVSLQTYLGLNQNAAGRMGNTLAAGVEAAGRGLPGAIQRAEREGLEAVRDAGGKEGTNYDGPMGMDPKTYADLAQRSSAAQQQANALGDNTGRATLLQQKYGQNSWGGGQLDAALAGAGSAGGRMQAAQGAYGKLLQRLGGAQTNVQQAGRVAADAKAAAANAPPPTPPPLASTPVDPKTLADEQSAGPHRESRPESRERNPYGRNKYTYP